MIGVGWVTYNRPTFLAPVLYSAQKLVDVADRFYLVDDGSTPEARKANQEATIYGPPGLDACWCPTNRGVAAAKNTLVGKMLADGADWLILAEDDILVESADAVTGYIRAVEQGQWRHLSFHAHGPHNPRPSAVEGFVTYWPNFVGAWAIYHRSCFETAGMFDETFVNAWEHCEHTLRLSLAGFHPLPRPGSLMAADATGSETWLSELPGAIENSVRTAKPGWQDDVADGRRHWRDAHPETYHYVFGERG